MREITYTSLASADTLHITIIIKINFKYHVYQMQAKKNLIHFMRAYVSKLDCLTTDYS